MSEKRVLVVDDDPLILLLLEKQLTSAGYEVSTAPSGHEALAALRQSPVPLLIVDWSMPGMSGPELVRAIRADDGCRTSHIIMLTGRSDVRDLVEAISAGADDFVAKPFHKQELLARLRAGERSLALGRLESESNRLRESVASMEQVLAVVGHELRTPLAGMRAIVEFLLSADAQDTAEASVFLQQLHAEVIRMSDITQDLLDAARLNSGVMRWNWGTVKLEAVANDALDTVRPVVKLGQVELSCACEGSDLEMRGDADAVRRLLINLMTNAARHTESGTIRLHISRGDAGEGDWVQLRVQDTGSGIAPEIAARLGEAFALNSGITGGKHVRGSGLGLAICKGIAAAHGGSISVDSAPGRGTTITVLLRADLEQPASRKPEAVSVQKIA